MIYLGADHRGFELKEKIKTWLGEWGYEFQDLGALKYQPEDDFVDYAALVAREVVKKKGSLGILVCGTGAGMDIASNKIDGVRSILALSAEHARRSKIADFGNVLSLAVDYFSEPEVRKMVRFFLETDYSSEPRYLRRVEKIRQLEKNN